MPITDIETTTNDKKPVGCEAQLTGMQMKCPREFSDPPCRITTFYVSGYDLSHPG